ncbi:unnamed protein product [Sphagnum compactum]
MPTSFESDSMGLRTPPVQVSNSLGDSSPSARQIDFENQLNGSRAGVFNPKVLVIGHRGCGKNNATSSQGEAVATRRPSIRENTIASFNEAARNGVDFVEFDVQVTKDGHPIIFHDTHIIAEDMVPRKIGDITLQEFLGMGPQKGSDKAERSLYRKARDGTVSQWTATTEDPLCTLEEAFKCVDPSVGFNIEVKFDYIEETSDLELQRVIHCTVEIVRQHSNGRKIYLSSFHPDAVHLLGSLQSTYPVFFLTLGGLYRFNDERRNSIQAAITVCQQSQLQGIVTEVNAVLHEPSLISLVKEAHLWLFTFGELNNVEEAVRKQKDAGVDGVIADHVMEIAKAVRQLELHPMSSS